MKTHVDYFDLAVKNTFVKTSKIFHSTSAMAPSPTIDVPFAEVKKYDEDLNCFDEEFSTCSFGNSTVEFLNRSHPADEVNRKVSYSGKALEELENIRKIVINDTVNEHVRKMTQFEVELLARMNATLSITREEINIKDRLMWNISESCISDDDLSASQMFSALLKRYSDQKWKEDSSVLSGNSEEFRNNDLNGTEFHRRNEIKKIRVDFTVLQDKMKKDVELCKSCSKLLVHASSEFKKVQEFTLGLRNVLHNTEINIRDDDIETGRMLIQWLSLLAEDIRKIIEQINEEEDEKAKSVKNAEKNSVNFKPLNEKFIIEKDEEKYSECIFGCRESLEFYSKLEDNLARVSTQVEQFSRDFSLKGFIRNLKISINTPINALSSLNPEHMRDKFWKISNLLRGNFTFPVSDFSDSMKNLCYTFLIDFSSKKIVSQGENLLIPSKPEDAFILASVIIAIWIDFPEFGPVLLAHLMKQCPYIIPAYWPQCKGQSEKDFYLSRGYRYKQDGTIENQDSFLKRMTGIFMLYIAVTVTVPRKNHLHPHGLRYAWKWLAATINLDPRPDITAALLCVFLDMAGYKLSHSYQSQFWKIMRLINSEYMIKIERVTSDDFRGPVSRLKETISKVLHDGRFMEPKGILSADYW